MILERMGLSKEELPSVITRLKTLYAEAEEKEKALGNTLHFVEINKTARRLEERLSRLEQAK